MQGGCCGVVAPGPLSEPTWSHFRKLFTQVWREQVLRRALGWDMWCQPGGSSGEGSLQQPGMRLARLKGKGLQKSGDGSYSLNKVCQDVSWGKEPQPGWRGQENTGALGC